MACILTITNQKGGAGKTTTALALAAGFSFRGYRTLSVDLDPQGNFTYSAGIKPKKTALGLLTGEATAQEAIHQTEEGFSVIAASHLLAGADAFISDVGKEYRLKEALAPVLDSFDFVVIDTPPALGVLTVNALTAADYVLIPAQADIYSLQGIGQLWETIQPIKRYANAKLQIAGIVLTRYNARSVLSRELTEAAEEAALKMNTRLFRSTIREGVAVKEAQLNRKSLFSYAPKSKTAADYLRLVYEVLEVIQ